jgi:hypothetical protein
MKNRFRKFTKDELLELDRLERQAHGAYAASPATPEEAKKLGWDTKTIQAYFKKRGA